MSQRSDLETVPQPIPYVGLANTEKSGALSACLQLLLHTSKFVADLQCHKLEQPESLTSFLQEICDVMRAADKVVQVHEDFHHLFFTGLGSDSSSYLIKIICQLSHEHCLRFGGEYGDAPFMKLFDGRLETQGKCIECNQPSQVTATNVFIDVPIRGMDSVASATRSFLMETERLEKWCKFCEKSTGCIASNKMQTAPSLICVKLMRFSGEGKRYDEKLSLSEELLLPCGWRYKLVGCVLHIGECLFSGQSMCLLKRPNGSFCLTSDSKVITVSSQSVQSSEAMKKNSFLVMYEQMEMSSPLVCDVKHVSIDFLNLTQENMAVTSPSNNHHLSAKKCFHSSRSKVHSSCKRKRMLSPAVTSASAAKVKKTLNFSFEADMEPVNNLNSLQNSQQVSPDFLHDDENKTSYVSILQPDPPEVSTGKSKSKKLKPRAIDFNTTSNNSFSSITSSKQTQEKAHLHRREMPRQVVVVRAVVRYETCVKMSEKKFKFFTGLSQYNFNVLFDLIGGDEAIKMLKYDYQPNTPKSTLPTRKFSSKNRLFLMLIRLRRGVPVEDLSYIFNISEPHVVRIYYAMVRVTYEHLILLQPHMFISAEAQKKHMPAPLRRFPNLRVIIDGAEFHIERPSDFQQQGNTFSSYKHYNTEKYLVGISSNGAVIFCSGGFEGSISDKELLKASGMMEYLQRGDTVMADRGFNVKSELAEIGVNLVKPANFSKKKQCLDPQEEVMTRDTASARIYVEHAIKSIKDWRLLRNIIPMSIHDLVPDMVFIAAFLSNFNKPYIKLSNRNKD